MWRDAKWNGYGYSDELKMNKKKRFFSNSAFCRKPDSEQREFQNTSTYRIFQNKIKRPKTCQSRKYSMVFWFCFVIWHICSWTCSFISMPIRNWNEIAFASVTVWVLYHEPRVNASLLHKKKKKFLERNIRNALKKTWPNIHISWLVVHTTAHNWLYTGTK